MHALARWTNRAGSELSLLLLIGGCGREEAAPPAVAPVAEPAPSMVGEVVPPAEPLTKKERPMTDHTKIQAALPLLAAMPVAEQRLAATVALDLAPAPCEPCMGQSIAACAVAGAACPPTNRLVARAVRIAGTGAPIQGVFDWIQLPDLWFAEAKGGELAFAPSPTEVRIELWLSAESSFLPAALADLEALTGDPRVRGEITIFVPESAEGRDALSRGALAAQAQGRGDAWLDRLAELRQSAASPAVEALLAEKIALSLGGEGLDLERWKADLRSTGIDAALEANRARAARLGVRAAPTWFIDGYRLRGAQSRPTLGRMVEVELSDLPAQPSPPGAP